MPIPSNDDGDHDHDHDDAASAVRGRCRCCRLRRNECGPMPGYRCENRTVRHDDTADPPRIAMRLLRLHPPHPSCSVAAAVAAYHHQCLILILCHYHFHHPVCNTRNHGRCHCHHPGENRRSTGLSPNRHRRRMGSCLDLEVEPAEG